MKSLSSGMPSPLSSFSSHPRSLVAGALPEFKKQPNAQAVLDEHLDALNHWTGIASSRSIRMMRRSTFPAA